MSNIPKESRRANTALLASNLAPPRDMKNIEINLIPI